MKAPVKYLLIVLGLAAAAALGTWWWHAVMELKWEARNAQSDAARRNRMLAATMLLRQSAHSVTTAGSLGELALGQLPNGTLLLASDAGITAPDKAAQLLTWVRRGNTLIAQPRWLSDIEEATVAGQILETELNEGVRQAKDDDDASEGNDGKGEAADDGQQDSQAELVETDPIAARLGVRVFSIAYAPPCEGKREDQRCKPVAAGKHAPVTRHVRIPGAAYPLELDAGRRKLIGMPGAATPLWSDQDENTVRVYQEGRGKIVMLADDFFNNDDLRTRDHGELLLALAALNPASKQVIVVRDLDAPRWYQLLWQHFKMALVALAALLALALWAALRRFGPVLPQPAIERRSLMEHIDASGAWLWKTKGGRDVLLEAARADTLALLRRRAPRLMRLSDDALCAALARQCKLPPEQVAQALHQAAAPTNVHFTRQIRILQELRNHHER
jgi:hypothetical protein